MDDDSTLKNRLLIKEIFALDDINISQHFVYLCKRIRSELVIRSNTDKCSLDVQ